MDTKEQESIHLPNYDCCRYLHEADEHGLNWCVRGASCGGGAAEIIVNLLHILIGAILNTPHAWFETKRRSIGWIMSATYASMTAIAVAGATWNLFGFVYLQSHPHTRIARYARNHVRALFWQMFVFSLLLLRLCILKPWQTTKNDLWCASELRRPHS